MKRIISIVLVAALCLVVISLSACGGVDEATRTAIELIDSIGEVTLDSERVLLEAEIAFLSLSEQQRNNVNNHNELVLARKSLDALIEQERIEQERIAEEDRIAEERRILIAEVVRVANSVDDIIATFDENEQRIMMVYTLPSEFSRGNSRQTALFRDSLSPLLIRMGNEISTLVSKTLPDSSISVNLSVVERNNRGISLWEWNDTLGVIFNLIR